MITPHENPAGIPTALITGASGGIGYEFAKLLAKDGYRIIIVARSADRLEAIARDFADRFGIAAVPITEDLAIPGAPDSLYAKVRELGLTVDILINNAGIGSYGLFAETDLQTELQLMQLNMVSLTHLTKLFLRDMLPRGRGRILNMASTAAYQPGPLMAVYFASKAYVLWLSEALANELEGTGVTVTAFCPGPTNSGFKDRAGIHESGLFSGRTMKADVVAQIGYRAMMRGRTVAIAGLWNRILAFLTRLVPRKTITRGVKAAQTRLHGVR